MEIKKFERRAYYHETDQMGVIHHSNYLKWMEEARIDFLDQMGLPYKGMEDRNIISPVLAVSLEYKNPVKFDEVVYFNIKITKFNGTKLDLSYEIINKETNVICVTATSSHCFLKDGKIISLKREANHAYEIINNYYLENQE